MSTRWRIAGLVLAGIAFVSSLLDPGRWLVGAPIIDAALVAVSVFVGVWLYEAVVVAARWLWRIVVG